MEDPCPARAVNWDNLVSSFGNEDIYYKTKSHNNLLELLYMPSCYF